MKLHYLFRYCFVLFLLQTAMASIAETSPSETPLKLEGIEASYILPAPVTVKITNISQGIIICGVGIQRQVDDRWQDFMTNIDDREPIRMQFKLRKINAHASITLTWEPKYISKPFEVPKGAYRVYVIYDVSKDDHRKFYSETFKIQ